MRFTEYILNHSRLTSGTLIEHLKTFDIPRLTDINKSFIKTQKIKGEVQSKILSANIKSKKIKANINTKVK